MHRRWVSIYWLLLLLIAAAFASLPFVSATVSVKSTGIIRPVQERTEVKLSISGILDSLYYSDGDTVANGAILARLQNNAQQSNATALQFAIAQHQDFVYDLQWLTAKSGITASTAAQLHSPLYKQQISRFLVQQTGQETSLSKSRHDLSLATQLANDSVIALNELFEKRLENDRMQAAYAAFKNEQQAIWQQDLVRYKLELAELQARLKALRSEARFFTIRAPVGGVLQNPVARYAGATVMAGETLCILSPETTLMAECYVGTKDAGLIQPGQAVRFQIDAFDYNYFGVLTGRVISVDNDFTVLDNKPVFKVRCAFDSTQLKLRNGYTGNLKKGLTFQSRFVVARRTLWQLLWDKVDNWLNPAAPVPATP